VELDPALFEPCKKASLSASDNAFNETLCDVIWQIVGRNLAGKNIVSLDTLAWFKRCFLCSMFTLEFAFSC
jgi:hypothetical protein